MWFRCTTCCTDKWPLLQNDLCNPGGDAEDEGEDSDEEEAQVQQAAEALLAGELPPPCLHVTLALRYMTDNSRITFHQVCCCSPLPQHT